MNRENNSPPSLEDLDRAPANLAPSSPGILNDIDKAKFDKLLIDFSDATSKIYSLEDDLAKERRKNTTRAILDDLIKPFAGRVFIFMCFYAAVVGCFVFYHGLNLGFHLPEGVLNYLVGSTAVTVLGLVGTVLTGIFIGAGK